MLPIAIKPDVYWIGAQDPDLRLFDDLFPTEHGTTYNSFLIKGSQKTAIIDTVKGRLADGFLDKVRQLVDPKTVDYLIVNHAEPDHSGSLSYLLEHCSNAKVVSTGSAKVFLGNLLRKPFPSLVVKDGDTLDLGGRRLRFITAPFLHWPDTMFTRLEEENLLFTCDAFGAHYCATGKLFDDETGDVTAARQFYFDCIFRPFKDKVLSAIDKIRKDRIDILCPSHGPLSRQDPWKPIEQFVTWSSPAPDGVKKVAVLYLSPHGHTEQMAYAVAEGAREGEVEVQSYHISHLDHQEIRNLLEEASALVFGVPTINRDIPGPLRDALGLLSSVHLKTNLVGVFGSYGWSGEACKLAADHLQSLGFSLVDEPVRNAFAPDASTLEQCRALGRAVAHAVQAQPLLKTGTAG